MFNEHASESEMGKCRGFVFALVLEHRQNKICKLSGITLEQMQLLQEKVKL